VSLIANVPEASIPSASTSSGVSSFSGTAVEAKQAASIWTPIGINEVSHVDHDKQPAGGGQILVEEFLEPMGLTQVALAAAMGVPRKHVNELCNGRRTVTAATALILARVFGNSADFWLNLRQSLSSRECPYYSEGTSP